MINPQSGFRIPGEAALATPRIRVGRHHERQGGPDARGDNRLRQRDVADA